MNKTTSPAAGEGFLPPLCSVNVLLGLVVAGELLAVLLAVADTGVRTLHWAQLGLVSAQVQWIVLSCAGLLCWLRPALARRKPIAAALLSYALVLGCTGVLSLVGQWLLKGVGRGYIDSWQVLSHLLMAAIIAGLLLRHLYLQQQLHYQQQSHLHARIQSLQARIEPHFLFNSMNSIASLIAIDPDRAEQVVEDLADLFRASLAERELVSAARELMLCRAYTRIEQVRLGVRLRLEWRADELPDEAVLPNLLIQPLLENAIFHGVEPYTDGGEVTFDAQRTEAGYCIEVTNSLGERSGQVRSGHHMALANIRDRLQAHFGEWAHLDIERSAQRFCARVTIDERGCREARRLAGAQMGGGESQ